MMNTPQRGYTLIELTIAVGVFALVMMLASGAYLVMISLSRQAQGVATGINNLSFAIETMTRDIRTGSNYCGAGAACSLSSFTFTDRSGQIVTYALGTQQGADGLVGDITKNNIPLTDPSVDVQSLAFYTYGTPAAPIDYEQSRVTMSVSGTVSVGAGKAPQTFTVETGATMRGPDI